MLTLKENGLKGMGKDITIDVRDCSMSIPGMLFQAGPYTGFQVAPRKQLVHVKDPRRGKEESFEIQLPWMIYVASVFDGVLSNIFLYASPDRVRSIRAPLYRIPLSNLYHDNRFCMPPGSISAPETTEGLFQKVLEVVWDSYYNGDLFDEIKGDVWEYPFMDYPKELPDDIVYKDAFLRLLSPGDVLKIWEENVSEENIHDLFNEHMRCDVQTLTNELPHFSARNIVRANCLQYMG